MFRLDRGVKRALQLREELNSAKLGRRELAKLGLIAGSAYYARGASLRSALAQTVSSSPLQPWQDELPVPGRAQPTNDYTYTETDHQWCSGRFPAQDLYRLIVQEHDHKFHKDLPPSKVWSYGGKFGGPVLDVRYGRPFCLHFDNTLPANHVGYGNPEITSHLHNFHTATESDGGPWNWVKPGGDRNQHYTMARAGFTSQPADFADPLAPGGTWWATDGGDGDLRETLTTLFIHDHRPEFTAANVYKGLFMMVRAYDQDDTGDETRGFRLPYGENGECDVPLLFQDKQIDPFTGEMTFDQFATDGFLGDLITVNGKYQPFMKVKRRRYRFRLLNGGPSRLYNFVLRKPGVKGNIKFTLIAKSGNLLPRSQDVTRTDIWVAERNDIVIDFTNYKDGDVLYLSNILRMRDDGRGSAGDAKLKPDLLENQVLRFEVEGSAPADDSSYNFRTQGPKAFRPLPPLPDLSTLPRKTFKFERKNGMWAINGRFWDPDLDHDNAEQGIPPLYVVESGTAELWTLESSSGGWDHPLHIHFEEGQVVRQNGVAVAAGSRYRTDIYCLRNNRLDLVLRFRDFPQAGFSPSGGQVEHTKADHGRYVMHCHNVVHEDHAMMATWSIRPPTS
jgi:FtsP/CotA-like multicopper oxidase with cupredoxin domain